MDGYTESDDIVKRLEYACHGPHVDLYWGDAMVLLGESLAEIKRMRELFHKDGEDHANRIKELTAAHEKRVTKYSDAIERLKKMVKDAYNDGFGQGMRDVQSSTGGTPWSECKYRKEVE